MAENEISDSGGTQASGDEGVVSQDDIDQLFASPEGDTGAQASEAPATPTEPVEAAGDSSQADIDAMLAGASGAGEASSDPPADSKVPTPSAESGEIDQADIDALLNATQGEAEQSSPATPAPVQDDRVDAYGNKFDAAAAEMAAAIEEEKAEAEALKAKQAAQAPPPPPPAPAAPPPVTSTFDMPEFSDKPANAEEVSKLDMLMDVTLDVKIELGRTRMLIEDVLKLGDGSVVELDKLAGDPVDVYVNDRLVARGEVLILNDVFCVRVSEVISHDPHRIGAA